jgi:hypothetical protein
MAENMSPTDVDPVAKTVYFYPVDAGCNLPGSSALPYASLTVKRKCRGIVSTGQEILDNECPVEFCGDRNALWEQKYVFILQLTRGLK